jgi:hypothetical protein
VNRKVELETRLMANPASAQRIDECVVNKTFLFFKYLFTLLARTRTAETLCAALPPETALPLAEGERAGRLTEVARSERRRLEATMPEEQS